MKKEIYRLLIISFLLASTTNAFSQSLYAKGCIPEGALFYKLPRSADLTQSPVSNLSVSASLKAYCPRVLSQGWQGSCTAFATAYYARTISYAIKNGWVNSETITDNAFSPAYIYNQIKGSGSCSVGSAIPDALNKMKTEGCLPLSDFPYNVDNCHRTPSGSEKQRASIYRIKDYRSLYDGDRDIIALQKIKKSISEKHPVVVSLETYSSFENSNGIEVWNGRKDRFISYHAMAIIGYDDKKFGGAFELINSWGTNFGQNGYIWVRYSDIVGIWRSAYEIIENPDAGAARLSAKISLELNTGYFREMPVTYKYDGIYATNEAYISGTRYRIYLDNNEPAYIYAFGSDLTGAVAMLFPLDNVSPLLPYKSNRVILPGKNYFLEMDHTKGVDFICVLYARSPLQIDHILQAVENGAGAFSDKVKRAVGAGRMIPSNQISYENNRISFNAKGKEDEVVGIIVEMEHR